MKTITESLEFLDKMNPNMINNTGKWTVEQMMYDDCKMHSYLNIEDYESILKELLKDKPKRIFDIGCNMNQYGFLFANEGIEYYGIDTVSYTHLDVYKRQVLFLTILSTF